MSEPNIELPEKDQELRFYSDHNQDHLAHVTRSAIKKARESIYIEIFSLSDKSIITLLNQKAKEGIRIDLITDKQYVRQTRSRLHPSIIVSTSPKKSGLMHRKILVIDEQWVWIGSVNFTWESLYMHHNLLMGAHSPLLSRMLTDPNSPQEGRIHIADQALDIWNIPYASSGLDHIKQSIKAAKKSLYVAMFTWTRKDLVDELILAKERGIDTKVILDKRSAEGASREVLSLLRSHQIPVRLSQGPPLMHHKFLWVDNQELYFGSVNWTEGGFSKNLDLLVRIPQLSSHQTSFMQTLWKDLWYDAR